MGYRIPTIIALKDELNQQHPEIFEPITVGALPEEEEEELDLELDYEDDMRDNEIAMALERQQEEEKINELAEQALREAYNARASEAGRPHLLLGLVEERLWEEIAADTDEVQGGWEDRDMIILTNFPSFWHIFLS